MPIDVSEVHIAGKRKKALASAGFMLVFLFGVFFNAEDGGGISLRKSVDFQLTTWRYIPEKKHHIHHCENLKFHNQYVFHFRSMACMHP
jgi:hypothetical protein